MNNGRLIATTGLVMTALCAAGLLALAQEKAGTATARNLQTAYADELTAKARFDAFAVKADEEGFKSAAALFRAASKAKVIRLSKSVAALKALGAEAKPLDMKPPAVKSTRENLEAALQDKAALDAAYPAFAKQAEADKNQKAMMVFQGDQAIEGALGKLFEQSLQDLNNGKAAGKEFLVCLVCGYVTADPKLRQCPVCAAPRSKFEAVK